MNDLLLNQQKLVKIQTDGASNRLYSHTLRLQWEPSSGRLRLKTESGWEVVRVKPCFPWSQAKGFFSLRDKDNNELGFVGNPGDLDNGSQKALVSSLKESSFHFSIIEILEIREEFELRFWKVNTLQGERRFQTRLTDWPRHLGEGFYIIEDVQKDLFVIEGIKILNESGKKLFWPFTEE